LQADSLPQAERAKQLVDAAEEAKQQARALSKGLMPIELDSHSLLSALEDLAERTRSMYDITCEFQYSEGLPTTNNTIATHLYRIAREAVHNALKHAKAKHIWIRLSNGNGLALEVRDDGIGIDESSATEGEGLRIMRYRARMIGAQLSIKRPESGGTSVTCELEK
jgi:signal transduction histidine kinase